MAKYSDIKGFTVQTLSTDPAASVAASGSWASGPNLNAACREGGGSGTSTSAINVGGYPYPMTAEQWNGSTWTTFTNMGTPRGKNASAGTYTNAITSAGATPSTPGYGTVNNNESWNGSAWSEIADLSSIREAYAMTAGGTNTAALVVGGQYSPGKLNVVEQWNGSSWTEVNVINTARALMAGAGTVTAGLISGGQSTGDSSNTETWNGSSWTEVNELNTARKAIGGSSISSTDALIFGGQTTTIVANTESWNGTSWTEVSDLATGRYQVKGSGPASTEALAFGGYTTTDVANTEEWTTTPSALFQKSVEGQLFFNSTANAFKETLKDAATGTWASVANLNVQSSQGSTGAGKSNSAALEIGGYFNPPLQYYATVEEFDGSSWTEIADLNEEDLTALAVVQLQVH